MWHTSSKQASHGFSTLSVWGCSNARQTHIDFECGYANHHILLCTSHITSIKLSKIQHSQSFQHHTSAYGSWLPVSSPGVAVVASPAKLAVSLLPSTLASPLLMVLDPDMPTAPEHQKGMHDNGLHGRDDTGHTDDDNNDSVSGSQTCDHHMC